MPAGRPSKMTEEIQKIILSRLSEGDSLSKICKSEDMPAYTNVYQFIANNEDFRHKYKEHKAIGIEKRFDELNDFAAEALDDPRKAAAYKLVVDTRKWVLSRQEPKKYGDRIEIDQRTDLTIKNETKAMSDEELLRIAGSKN